jgi:hypothetical protein
VNDGSVHYVTATDWATALVVLVGLLVIAVLLGYWR